MRGYNLDKGIINKLDNVVAIIEISLASLWGEYD